MARLRLEDIGARLRSTEPRLLPAPPGSPSAAVATVLRSAGDEVEALFIRRAECASDPWSGHMAFPGGRRDPGDPDLEHTVRRETLEELGLDLDRTAEPLGHLDEIEAIARGKPPGMVIRPYVFALHTPHVALEPNYEVAEALWVPLGPLVRGEADSKYLYRNASFEHELPAYAYEGRIVWGLTYQMLQILFATVRTA
jgi:8-oxo-dGTP pyrophosphatase MutT (NUDIX family)